MSDKKTAGAVPEVPAAPKSDAVAEAVKAALVEALPLAAMAAAQAQANAQMQVQTQMLAQKRGDHGPRCDECGQARKGCKGEHVQMAVFPNNEEYAPWFPGLKLNGVTYRSQHGSHLITVPALNDFASMLQAFEKSEREFRTGRVASHNSGVIGPNGSHTTPAHVPNWRG